MPLRRKKRDEDRDATKVFFCTDIHGSTVCFRKFVNASQFYGARILILGGDVTGKMVVPIARQPSGDYVTTFSGGDVHLETAEDVAAFTKRVSNMGFYPKVMDEGDFVALKESPEAQEELFRELIRERLEEWISYTEDKLAGTDIEVYAAPGNDDFFEVDDILASSERIVLLEMQVHHLTPEHEILTTAWTNQTPWNTERECSEEELGERLETMIDKVENMETCIFNTHCPPHNARIDMCPELDDEFRVVYKMGNPVFAPAGSTAVRDAIERHEPILGLHGHIHEGRGEASIGRTLCLNPGSVYSEGILNGVLVTLANGKVRDYQFTQG